MPGLSSFTEPTPKPVLRSDPLRHLDAEKSQFARGIFLDGWRGALLALACFGLAAFIAWLDNLTGPDLSFGLFYLLAIALAAWWGGFSQGILSAMACAICWQLVEVAEGSTASPGIHLWNGIARFGIFAITSSLLARLRASLFLEKRMARSDPLTGAANGRTFYESVSFAVEQAHRTGRPITLAYFDLDQFKWINDNLGHNTGDQVLCELVQLTHQNIRNIDLLARLGGDEFALLLENCDGDDARSLLERIRERFVQHMIQHRWPVTLSIGAVTFPTPPRDVDAMVRRVDELMYRAKKAGKNRIVHETVAAQVDVEKSSVHERRASARVISDRMARVRSADESKGLDDFARVRDISATGLCLFLERKLPDNTLLAVEPLHECGAVTLVVRILWSVEENGGWLHECVLPNRLTSAELPYWTQEQVAESCHDCR